MRVTVSQDNGKYSVIVRSSWVSVGFTLEQKHVDRIEAAFEYNNLDSFLRSDRDLAVDQKYRKVFAINAKTKPIELFCHSLVDRISLYDNFSVLIDYDEGIIVICTDRYDHYKAFLSARIPFSTFLEATQ